MNTQKVVLNGVPAFLSIVSGIGWIWTEHYGAALVMFLIVVHLGREVVIGMCEVDEDWE